MSTISRLAALSFGLLLGVSAANAAYVTTDHGGGLRTFFGQQSNSSAATAAVDLSQDAGLARTAWSGSVTGLQTETFSGFPADTAPDNSDPILDLDTLDATLTCKRVVFGAISRTCAVRTFDPSATGDWAGRFDTTNGSGLTRNFLENELNRTGNIDINFVTAISAFSFYMTDANDFGTEGGSGSSKSITLTDTNNATTTILISDTAAANGNLIFFGLYNTGDTRYTKISISNTNNSDGFGIDDAASGFFRSTPTLPEPATLLLLTAAAAAAAALRKRRR